MTLLALILYGTLLALNVLDGHYTWKVLRPSHLSRESNPLARWIFARLGLLKGIVVAELLWIGFITLVVWLAFRIQAPAWDIALIALLAIGNLVFLGVVIHNVKVWRNLKRKARNSREDQ